ATCGVRFLPFPTRRSSDLTPCRTAISEEVRMQFAPVACKSLGAAPQEPARGIRRISLDHLRPMPLRLGLGGGVGDESCLSSGPRSEEHTSELQSREKIVCR